MTNTDIDYIETELSQTTISYAKWRQQGFTAGHWKNAVDRLNQLRTAAPSPPVVPTPPPSSVLFTQGYSATAISALRTAGNIVAPNAWSCQFPSASVARFEVRSGDQYLSWSGERAQIQLPQMLGGEGERWRWQFTFTLDPAFQFASGFYNVLWEHHHQGSTGSPPLTFQLHGNRIVLRLTNTAVMGNDWTEYDLAPATPGHACVVEVDCLLSSDPAKASTVITIDGNTKAITGKPNLYAGSKVYVEWGLYRAPSPLTQIVTFGPVSRVA